MRNRSTGRENSGALEEPKIVGLRLQTLRDEEAFDRCRLTDNR